MTNETIVRRVVFALTAAVVAGSNSIECAADSFWDRHIINHISMREGLPCNFVDAICQDDNGLVWFATNGGGLTQYDGYSYTTYNCSNSPTMTSNFVHTIAKDGEGRLWVGTDCGLNILDTHMMRLDQPQTAVEADSAVIADRITSIVIDNREFVWAAMGHNLVCMRMDANGKILIVGSINMPHVITVLSSGTNGVYVGSRLTVQQASVSSRNGKPQIKEVHDVGGVPAIANIEAIAETPGFLWVGTSNGLLRINTSSDSEKLYLHSDADPHSLTQDRISDIKTDNNGNVIIATLKGLNTYNRENDNFERLTQDDSAPGKGLCSNFINCLCPTSYGLWVGTDVAGADLISPVALGIRNYTSDEVCNLSMANKKGKNGVVRPINALAESVDGTLWIGTIEGGLSKKSRDDKGFRHYNTSNHGLAHNSISAIDIDGEGRLWAGTWGAGLNVIDTKAAGDPVIHLYDTKGRERLTSDFVGVLKYDSINNGVWVGTIRDIVFICEHGIVHPLPDTAFKDMNGALGADIDGKGNLWIGTSIGLFVIDLRSFKGEGGTATVDYTLMQHKLDDSGMAGDPRITYIYHSQKKQCTFIGTNGFGFYVYPDEGRHRQFTLYSTENGLANNLVSGIAEDDEGNMWIATRNGLSLLTWRNKQISTFTTDDGLMSDSYYWNAALSSHANGHVFFGSLDGLTEVYLLQSGHGLTADKAPILTRLEVSNRNVLPQKNSIIDRNIEQVETITIHESDKSLGVEFSALKYTAPLSVRYQYMLEGFDDRWIDVPRSQRSAQYTNLAAGDYKLRVRYTTVGGKWSNERILHVIVRPFFYKTVWFILLLVAVASALIWFIFHIRLRSIEASRKMLHKEVQQRTRELREQKQMLESKKAELEETNDKLVAQNSFITRQKESMLEMTAKIQRLSIDKLQFFTSISHELRTPLTLITGPVKRALSLCDQPEVETQLQLIERSAHSLLTTVNQLMDFRCVETGSIELHPVSTHLQNYMVSILAPYVAYAAEQGITLRTFYRIATPYVRIDMDAISKIMSNLLSNAIKYSDGGRVIDVFVGEIFYEQKAFIYICVRDRGKGIPTDQIDKIFDRFYRTRKQDESRSKPHQSTGFGLYVVHGIVTLCDGEITAHNNRGGGLSMRILLPLLAGHEKPSEEKETAADGSATAEPEAVETQKSKSEAATERQTILVVEDSRDMRTYIHSILESSYRVIEAADGVAGLAAMAEHDIDFVITDLVMPNMDGLEFARKVKADFAYSHTPILILTAHTDGAYQTESYRIGVESYLHKPFDEDMLRARISGILSSMKSNQKKFLTTLDTSDLNIQHESDDEKFVMRVTDFVKANYRDPEFSIDDIVTEVGCSKSMLHKKMQSVMGQAPGYFIRTYRLNIAREILSNKNNGLNVSQVAYEVGFNDPKYFSRCFAKAFGYPPSTLG